MLATACDYRLMVDGKAKISLNEIAFGSTVFQSAIEILKYWVGGRMAQKILFSADMYSAQQALEMGIIDEIVEPDKLSERTAELADHFGKKNPAAYAHMKKMLRGPVVDVISSREQKTIAEFVEIWYSDTLRENLKKIEIRN